MTASAHNRCGCNIETHMFPINGPRRIASIHVCEEHANDPDLLAALKQAQSDGTEFPTAADMIELVSALNENVDPTWEWGGFEYRDTGSECGVFYDDICLWADSEWTDDLESGKVTLEHVVRAKFAELVDHMSVVLEKFVELPCDDA